MANDYNPRNYQDDFANDEDHDIITEEETDNLAERAGVPEETLKEEFDGMDTDDSPLGTRDDIENEIEDEDDEL